MGISEQEDDRKIYNPFLFGYQYAFLKRYDDSIREPMIDVCCGDSDMLDFILENSRKDIYGIDFSRLPLTLQRSARQIFRK